jgi:hypothetical protein
LKRVVLQVFGSRKIDYHFNERYKIERCDKVGSSANSAVTRLKVKRSFFVFGAFSSHLTLTFSFEDTQGSKQNIGLGFR